MELARVLVPINFTRASRFRHDPALTIPPLPTIATATELNDFDEATLGFALNQLTRGQNRLVSAFGASAACRSRDRIGVHVSLLQIGNPARPQGEQGAGG